jgi:hypothetical protein
MSYTVQRFPQWSIADCTRRLVPPGTRLGQLNWLICGTIVVVYGRGTLQLKTLMKCAKIHVVVWIDRIISKHREDTYMQLSMVGEAVHFLEADSLLNKEKDDRLAMQ